MKSNFSSASDERLSVFINNLFVSAPACDKTVEVKTEILQNLTDKYNDLLKEGKTEDEAFNIAVGSLGDITPIIDELRIEYGNPQPSDGESYSGYIDGLKQKSALVISLAIMMYIASPVPYIFLRNKIGIIGTFVMVAVATGMLIYNKMTKPHELIRYENEKRNLKRAKRKNKIRQYKDIFIATLWVSIIPIYFIISFITHAWAITWIVFFVAVIITIWVEM